MSTCRKCLKKIDTDAVFCPYCGEKITSEQELHFETDSNAGETCSEKRAITKKQIILILAAVVAAVLVGVVISCEVKIANAKKLYIQGEYWKAYTQVRNIPSLGREDVIRIKTASWAGEYYDSYLTTKRIRLSSTGSKHPDAYREAFWELTFGLHLDLKRVQDDDLNDIEKDEYQKFIDIFYSELQEMYYMSKTEVDMLMEQYRNAEKVSDMKDIANEWLDVNFFD